MAMKGLGRGLDALLGEFDAQTISGGVRDVSIDKIFANPDQPRKAFDEARLAELAGSIKLHGVVQPLVVRQDGDRYMIVTGERRFRASRMAGLKAVPVVVREYEDRQLHEIALIENIQRENLNPIEEAAAISFLMKQHDLTQEEVAERLSKSRPAVTNTLRLLNLPESVKSMLKSGSLSAGHGRALAALNDPRAQERLAGQAVESGCSVRAIEQMVSAAKDEPESVKEGKPRVKPAPKANTDLLDFEERLRERLGTKVKVQGSLSRGRITVEYFDRETLDALFALLLDDSVD